MATGLDFEPYSLIDDGSAGKQQIIDDKRAGKNSGTIKQDFKKVESNLDLSKLDYSPDYTRVTNPQMHRIRRQLITKEFPKIKVLLSLLLARMLFLLLRLLGVPKTLPYVRCLHSAHSGGPDVNSLAVKGSKLCLQLPCWLHSWGHPLPLTLGANSPLPIPSF